MKHFIATGLTASLLLLLVSCKKEQVNVLPATVTNMHLQEDAAGNAAKFASVVIGTQTWMSKNLCVSHYRNGDKIPQVRNSAKWRTLTTGAWCWPNNDSLLGAVYGKIYNWYAVNDPRGLAPRGWHVPADTEWTVLVNYLGGATVAGGKLKEAGTAHWWFPNTAATNSTGYTGIPAGNRYNTGDFLYLHIYGWCWTSTEENSLAVYRRLNYNDAGVFRGAADKRDGFTLRCVED